MTKKIIFIILLLANSLLNAQTFSWAKSIAGTNNQQVNSIVADRNGNTYSVGNFIGTADFDPGVGVFSLTSATGTDIFILKLDSLGQFVWAKRIGGVGTDEANSITIDHNDNLIITGNYRRTVDFDPNIGVTNLPSTSYGALFVMKMTVQGNLVWAKGMVSTTDYPLAFSVTVDSKGSIYTTGRHKGNVDFDPGAGTNFISAQGLDIYIHKLDSAGSFVWVKSFGSSTPYVEQGKSIAIDKSDNIYVTGTFRDVVDFDRGPGVQNLSAGTGVRGNIFILKYTENGDYIWAKNIGNTATTSAQYGNAIAVDKLGNSYITGQFIGTVDFDPSPTAVKNLIPNGGQDIFVLKLDSSGNYQWANSMGGLGIDEGLAITSDYFGNVYITGKFGGSSDFDPGPDTTMVTSNGNYDLFIQKLTTTGSLEWVKQIGASGPDIGTSIYVEKNGSTIYTAGHFWYNVDFDTDTSVFNIASLGSSDGFIHKLGQIATCIPTSSSVIINSCLTYTSPSGKLFTTSGVYYDTMTNSQGCDSILSINLTIPNSINTTDSQIACDSFTWINGTIYTVSDSSATDTLTGSGGCDSIVTLNLMINYTSSSTDIQSVCGSYTWIDGNTYVASNSSATYTLFNAVGCDSIITLNLTLSNSSNSIDIQNHCENFTWINGITYTANNNTAKDTLVNSAGCDSIISLNLTLVPIDITTTNNGANITANESPATYQWLKCWASFAIVTGATNQILTPTENGIYAVEIMKNGCTDTSICESFFSVNLTEFNSENIAVFPNPVTSIVNIELIGEFNKNLVARILSTKGDLIYSQTFEYKKKLAIDMDNFADGIYILQISTENSVIQKKIVKQ
jgi:hypothetical protein